MGSRISWTIGCAAASLLALAACGSKNGADGGLSSGSGSGNGTGTGSGTGSGSSGTHSGSGSGGGISVGVGSGSGGSSGTGTASTGAGGGCLTATAQGKPKPLDILLLLDRSVSMKGGPWNGATKAMTDFVNDPSNTDVSFGVDFFPSGDKANACATSLYNPPSIPLEALPMGAADLTMKIGAATPNGYDTPIYPALYGALLYATAYQDANPGHKVVVVLASDGDANSCNPDPQNIAAKLADISGTAFGYNGVLTFAVVINTGSKIVTATLDGIAAAGGTNQSIDITNDISKLKDTLAKVRQSALACEYDIPTPMMGQKFDPLKLNLKYTPGMGGMPSQLPNFKNAQQCGTKEGWYYDNNTKPTKILFCPASCAKAKLDPGAKVDFVFGCPTEVGNPG